MLASEIVIPKTNGIEIFYAGVEEKSGKIYSSGGRVLSVCKTSEKPFKSLKQFAKKIKMNNSKVRQSGADFLYYTLIDSIVDHYFLVMEKLGDKIEVLEEDIFYDLNEAEMVGSTDRVTIVSQMDRYNGAFEGDGDWTDPAGRKIRRP